VLETALSEEMTEHLGFEKNQAGPGRQSANVRNGARSRTVISDAAGEVRIDVPRDREETFGPQIVKKRQRRLADVDEIVLSLYAKGLTTGEISAHFAEIYGAPVPEETVSRITEKVVAEMQEWATRPLDAVYVAVADALPVVLTLCPPGVRVAAWHRGERPTRSRGPLHAWEPVIRAAVASSSATGGALTRSCAGWRRWTRCPAG
jgi:hypothetical protein